MKNLLIFVVCIVFSNDVLNQVPMKLKYEPPLKHSVSTFDENEFKTGELQKSHDLSEVNDSELPKPDTIFIKKTIYKNIHSCKEHKINVALFIMIICLILASFIHHYLKNRKKW